MDTKTKDLLYNYPKQSVYKIEYLDKSYKKVPKKCRFDYISKMGRNENYELDELEIYDDDTIKTAFVKFLLKTNTSCLMSQMCILYEDSKDKSVKCLTSKIKDATYEINPSPSIIFDTIDRLGNIRSNSYDITSKILDDFDIKNNTLYFVRLNEWLSVNNEFDIKDIRNLNGVIKKYWPFSKNEDIQSVYSDAYSEEIKAISDRYKEVVFDEYLGVKEINNRVDKKEYLEAEKFIFYHLHVRKMLSTTIDIESLFSNVELSHDIPVSMLHKKKFRDNRYKIFKDAISQISIPQFKTWQSGIELVPDIDTIHFNPRQEVVTFHVKINDGCHIVVDIYKEYKDTQKGCIELKIDKKSMINITLDNQDHENLRLSAVIDTVNKTCLSECKLFVEEMEELDKITSGNFFSTKSGTEILEMGGKLTFSDPDKQKCGSGKETSISIEKKIHCCIPHYYPFIRVRGITETINAQQKRDTLIDKGNRFVYKRKSDYTKLDSISAVILPLIKEDMSKTDILSIMAPLMSMSTEETEKVFNKIIKSLEMDERKFAKDKIEQGISCRIEEQSMKIDLIFDGVQTENELKRLVSFSSVFIEDILDADVKLKGTKCLSCDSRVFKDVLKRKNFAAAAAKQEFKPRPKEPVVTISSSGAEVELKVAATEDFEEKDTSELSASESASSEEIDDFGGGSRVKARYHQNEIKEHDRMLVEYTKDINGHARNPKIATQNTYVKKCPGDMQNRQPYIIKDIDHKVRLEKKWTEELGIQHPFGSPDYVDNKLNFINPPNSQIKWIRAGTTYEKIAYYLCNKFWCVKCKLPLPNNYEEISKSTNCPFCGCKYYGSIKKDKHVTELTDEIGTVIERGAAPESYWTGKKQAKFRPAYVDPIHPDYYEMSKTTPLYLNMIPCCFSGTAPRDTWQKGVKEIIRKQREMDVGADYDLMEETIELEEEKQKQDITKKGSSAKPGWQKVLVKAEENSTSNRGDIHPELQRKIFNFEDFIKNRDELVKVIEAARAAGTAVVRNRAEQDYKILLKNEKLKGPFKRYGVEQNNKIFYSLATILGIKDKKKMSKDRVLIDRLNGNVSILNFIQAKNGELVVEFSRPYSEFDKHLSGFGEWIKKNSKFSASFINEYFKGSHWTPTSNQTTEQYIIDNKDTAIIRQLYKIYTAYTEYFKNIDRLDYQDVLPLIAEWKPKLFICIINIVKFTKDSEIELICPEYSSYKTYDTISFINLQNGAYEPICYDPMYIKNEFKFPIFKLPKIAAEKILDKLKDYNIRLKKIKETEKKIETMDSISKSENELQKAKIIREYQPVLYLFEMGYAKTLKDQRLFNLKSLPLLDKEHFEILNRLFPMSKKPEYKYYTDSWSKTRFILLKIEGFDLVLPVSPTKMLTRQDTKDIKITPLVYTSGIFPEKLKLLEYRAVETEVNRINEYIQNIPPTAPGHVFYNIQGIYVDEQDTAVGYFVNRGSIIFFTPIRYSKLPEHLKALHKKLYINEFAYENNIYFPSKEEEKDARIDYKENTINENLLYAQYRKEIASTFTTEQLKFLYNLLDVDIEREMVQQPVYLYHLHKMMWNHDKREKVHSVVKFLTDKHIIDDKDNPFSKWNKDIKRLKQKPCNKTKSKRIKKGEGLRDAYKTLQRPVNSKQKEPSNTNKKICDKRVLCKYDNKTCKLKIGGESYWTGKDLLIRFTEMLTDEILYGGKLAMDILKNKVREPDPRLKAIYNYTKDEEYLTGEETRNSNQMDKIFNINKEKFKNKTNSWIFDDLKELKGGKRRTARRKNKRRTVRKKNKRRTVRKKRHRRTFSKKMKKDKTLKNNIF